MNKYWCITFQRQRPKKAEFALRMKTAKVIPSVRIFKMHTVPALITNVLNAQVGIVINRP